MTVDTNDIRYHRESDLDIILSGSTKMTNEIVEQLTWLAAAFRIPANGSPKYSESDIHLELRDDGIDSIRISPLTLSDCFQTDKNCWHQLFRNTGIVRGFPIPDRYGMEGLELPFDLMAHLAGSQYLLPFSGGTILRGFSTILVPIAATSSPNGNGTCLQWHLEIPQDKPQPLSTERLLKHPLPRIWYLTEDYDVLTHARTFLGYAGKASVHLGTEDSNFRNVDESGCNREGTSFRILQAGIGPSLSFAPAGVQIPVNFTIPKGLSANIQHYQESDEEIIGTTTSTDILVYDPVAKRGWLVPETSVILHILHSWRSKREPPVNIPFAAASTHGARAAAHVIRNSARKIIHPNSDESKPPVYLIDMFKNIVTHFKGRREAVMQKFEQPGVSVQWKRTIKGWEYNDIVNLKATPFYRTVDVSENQAGQWVRLVNNMPDLLVIFASGIGQLIQPEPQSLCTNCSNIPCQRFYLTAHMKGINRLVDAGLGVSWTNMTSEAPFRECKEGITNFEDRVQQLFVKKSSKIVHERANMWHDGALIFGVPKRQRYFSKREPTKCIRAQTYDSNATPMGRETNADEIDEGFVEGEQM